MAEFKMKVSVTFYGQLAELVKESERHFLFIENETINELQNRVCNEFPELMKVQFTTAVNGTMAQGSELISGNDKLDFFPPFAGG